MGSLTNYEGGTSFLVTGLPRYEDNGEVNYGFLGVAGARVIEATFGGRTQVGIDTTGARSGSFATGSLRGPTTTGTTLDTSSIKVNSTADALQSVGQQLIALAAQTRAAS